eukprot:scaffold5391_cov29-Tisochrysis_lutea.AAC.2
MPGAFPAEGGTAGCGRLIEYGIRSSLPRALDVALETDGQQQMLEVDYASWKQWDKYMRIEVLRGTKPSRCGQMPGKVPTPTPLNTRSE